MRSPFAYTPRPGPLQAASPAAAVAYLGALVAVAFTYSNPVVLLAAGVGVTAAGLLAGARAAVGVALRMGFGLALLIVAVNALVVNRGATVLARLGGWPLLGQVDVTAEALAAGATIGLRAAVAMVAFAVYSACVDPDRVLRALQPLAGRSALTATLVSRLVPLAAADAGRLRDAARLRGPGAAEAGRAPLARRLLAGSLDRAVDVAATLELRGYGLERPRVHGARRAAADGRQPDEPTVARVRLGANGRSGQPASRFDRRFFAVGAAVLLAAVAATLLGADSFRTYPTIRVGLGPATLALSALLVAAGLAPLRRKAKPSALTSAPAGSRRGRPAPPRGPAAAPARGGDRV